MISLGVAAAGAVTVLTTWLGQRSARLPKVAIATLTPAPTPLLTIIPRAQWGAVDPQVTATGRGEHGPYAAAANPNGWLVYDLPLEQVLDTIIIHHSALPVSDGPLEVQRFHMEEKGFADIAYHYLIDPQGSIYAGRALNVRGAHTAGHNYGSVGVCLTGNFEEITPSPEQVGSLTALVQNLVASYPRIQHLAGHRDCNPETLCPGKNLYAGLPALAQESGLHYGI